MKSLYSKDQYIIFFLWFVLIFGPVLDVGLGRLADTSFLIAVLLTMRLAWVGLKRIDLFMIACLSGVFFLSAATLAFSDLGQHLFALRAPLRPFRATIIYLAIVSLSEYTVTKLKSRNESRIGVVLNALFLVYLTVVLHGAIMLLQFVSPDIRNFIYNLTFAKNQLEFYQQFRMAGLSGGGGAQVSAVQGMGTLIAIFVFSRGFARGTVIFTLPILLGSIILSGRTGILVFAISCVFGLFLLLSGRIKGISFGNFMSVLAAMALLSFFGGQVLSLFTGSDYFEIAFNRTFDTVINFFETRAFEDTTVNALSGMFILPESFLHIIFGQASYIENNTFYGINTDIGYFRLIWAYGLLGLALHVMFYGGFLRISILNSGLSASYVYFCMVFIFLIFFLNTKEIFFLTSMSFPMMGGCIMFGRFATIGKD